MCVWGRAAQCRKRVFVWVVENVRVVLLGKRLYGAVVRGMIRIAISEKNVRLDVRESNFIS